MRKKLHAMMLLRSSRARGLPDGVILVDDGHRRAPIPLL
eukprot:COSAG06_NODE_3473_length_5293_cov_1.697728_2_plen_39_part_00